MLYIDLSIYSRFPRNDKYADSRHKKDFSSKAVSSSVVEDRADDSKQVLFDILDVDVTFRMRLFVDDFVRW